MSYEIEHQTEPEEIQALQVNHLRYGHLKNSDGRNAVAISLKHPDGIAFIYIVESKKEAAEIVENMQKYIAEAWPNDERLG